MAFRVSPSVALLIVFSLMAVAHCVPLEAAELATNASSSAAVATAEVDAVSEGEGLPLRLPYSEESILSDAVAVSGDEEVPGEEEAAVEPVAEPDPDRSHPDSDGEEELTAKKQIDSDEDEDEAEEKKTRRNHGGDKEEKKKRKKRHGCDGKDKKEKKTKTKRHQSNDEEEEEEEEEEKMKKKIHRHHHHVERKKTKKLTRRDSDDDDDEQEKKEKRWRKAISRSMFGRGRRSQREEAATEEVNN